MGVFALYTPEKTLHYRSLVELPVIDAPPALPAMRWEFTPYFYIFFPVFEMKLTSQGQLLCPQELSIELQPSYDAMMNRHVS